MWLPKWLSSNAFCFVAFVPIGVSRFEPRSPHLTAQTLSGLIALADGLRSPSRKGGLNLQADVLAFWHTRHARQFVRDPHLRDEGAASPAHSEVQPHVEALPRPEFVVDEKASAFCDFTASQHQINPYSGPFRKDSIHSDPLQADAFFPLI